MATSVGEVSIPFMEKALKILVVDDDPLVGEFLRDALCQLGHEVAVVQSGIEGLKELLLQEFDLVICDMMMPGMDGLEFLKAVKERRLSADVVIITGFASIESAVEALKLGAYDYIQKPVRQEVLLSLVNRVAEKRYLLRENILLKETISRYRWQYGDIIGSSQKMQSLYSLLERLKGRLIPVLIYGESGTGKELVARTIWKESPRCNDIFIAVNCGTIVDTLAESELFGHVQGSFTGAYRDKKGLFEAANGGTLFLDELTELPLSIQAKLLRAIEQKKIRKVGDTKEIDVDVRLIVATNQDPDIAVEKGTLRKDLYYRLNVVCIKLPPLRERKEDIDLLLDHFVKKNGIEAGVEFFSDEALEVLKTYDWPGNVRELEHLVQRMIIFCDSNKVQVEDLPIFDKETSERRNYNSSIPLNLKENEAKLIERALQVCNGNKLRAAKLLGINPSTLYRKLKRLSQE